MSTAKTPAAGPVHGPRRGRVHTGNRDHRVATAVTAEQHATFSRLAAEEGLTVSSWLYRQIEPLAGPAPSGG